MQFGDNTKRLPNIDHESGCDCVQNLAKKMNKNRVQCHGLLCITDSTGKHLVGLHTFNKPTVIGSRPSTGLVVFNFCPFCGAKLYEGGSDETQTLDSEN